MTPDELRGLVFAAMAAEDEAAGYQATFQGLTDVVMPVLAEALAERDAEIAELRGLLRARDENLHVEAEGWRDIVSAVHAQEAVAKAERDRWRGNWQAAYDVNMTALETIGHLRAGLVTARAQINEWRGHFTSIAEILRPYGDEVDSPVELAGKAAAEIQQLRAELDRWVDSARAASDWLVRFSAGYPMGTRYAEIIERIEQDRADLAQLRERAVVLPEDMDSQIRAALNESPHLSDFEALAALGTVARLIESWRPSTGDTEWHPQPGDLVTGKARNAHDRDPVGRYVDTLDTTARIDVTDAKQADYPNMVSSLAYVDADTLRPAALPEGTPAETTYRSSGTVQRGLHAESAWGVDRPVHGHTEQTGDQA